MDGERFEVRRLLGRGGMGYVHEAWDRERGALVAIKSQRSPSPEGLLRLRAELRVARAIRHPNVVRVGELVEQRGDWFFTQELVDGENFLSYVRPGGELDEDRLRAALAQLASGLGAVHAAGKVHRDIKPANVLVTREGRVVIVDFGLAADMAEPEVAGQDASEIVGTLVYVSPEQIDGKSASSSDWYSVGVVLYEALTGIPAFRGSLLHVLKAKRTDEITFPQHVAPVFPDLRALCLALLRSDPSKRAGGAEVLRVASRASASAGPRGAALTHRATRMHIDPSCDPRKRTDSCGTRRASALASSLL
jgi:serine/threonine protein kinase